jgi:hypothetical protein
VPRVAQNGTVIMVIANSGYLEFLLNWKSYVDQQNITNYIIIPVDVQMAQQLSYLGTISFSFFFSFLCAVSLRD